MKIIKGSTFEKLIKELEYMTTFECDEYDTPIDCWIGEASGKVCNSCWARSFAEKWLKKWGQL